MVGQKHGEVLRLLDGLGVGHLPEELGGSEHDRGGKKKEKQLLLDIFKKTLVVYCKNRSPLFYFVIWHRG